MYYIEERRKEVAQMLAQGHNETEIAQILGIEMNTAKVRLHRARARLKEKMETYFAQEVKDL